MSPGLAEIIVRRGIVHPPASTDRIAPHPWPSPHKGRSAGYARHMTVGDMLATLQRLPREAELLAFEPGCEDYCEREVDELELQGGRVCLHLGARRHESRGR
jgi:hypothetical protein